MWRRHPKKKAVITSSVVAVAVATKYAVYAYRAYRLAQTAHTLVGVVRMLNSAGHSVQVGVRTDGASIDRARASRDASGRSTSNGASVGSVSANYFNDRAAELSQDEALTCPPQRKNDLQREMHDICDGPGPGSGACKGPNGGATASYCADLREKLARSQRCVSNERAYSRRMLWWSGSPGTQWRAHSTR